jgi:hypothetical protein
MRIKNFSNYTKLYESRLLECQFFTEQNVTSEDIIRPLEGLITEEFLEFFMNEGFGDWAKDKWEKGKKFAKDIYKNVKDAISSIFGKVVDFFKNFSLSKLIGSIYSKIKEIGSKAWNKIKEALGAFKEFIVGNGLANEDNTPNFGKIWSVLCEKGKSLIDWKEEGVTPDKLKQAGEQIKINEADAHSIGDDEIKYYGMFEKIAHALGIKNARFNGVVSQIMKKGVIGIAIMSILKVAGLASFAALGIGALSPVAMAAIGGMLLMAGLIILAIWVCKPYPTVDDCLAYLHIAFGGNCQAAEVKNIFVKDIQYYYSNGIEINIYNITNYQNNTSDTTTNNYQNNTSDTTTNNYQNNTSDTTTNNIYDIDNDVDVNTGIGIGDGGPLKVSDSGRSVSKSDLKVGQEYIYTSKRGKRIVKVVSLTHDVLSGKDKKWFTGDDKEREKVKDGYVDVVYQDKNGGYSTYTNFSPVLISKLTALNGEMKVGQEYIYKNREGKERIVKIVSLTHDVLSGKDKKWGTSDDKEKEKVKDGYVDVIYQDKDGKYSTYTNFLPVLKSQLTPLNNRKLPGTTTNYLEANDEFQVGQKYIYTNKEGEKKVVILVSKTHSMKKGDDKEWATGDDEMIKDGELPNSDTLSVAIKNKDGKYGNTSTGVSKSQLTPLKEKSYKESLRYISSFEKYNNK